MEFTYHSFRTNGDELIITILDLASNDSEIILDLNEVMSNCEATVEINDKIAEKAFLECNLLDYLENDNEPSNCAYDAV